MNTHQYSAIFALITGILLPSFQAARALVRKECLAGAIVVGLVALPGCCLDAASARATSGAARLEVETLLVEPPSAGYYRAGQLVLQYDIDADQIFLTTAWQVAGSSPEHHSLRTAVLDFAAELPESLVLMPDDWEHVTLFGHERWQALVSTIFEKLAVESTATATLVAVHQTDFVLHRTDSGQLDVLRLEDKPAALPIGRRISEEAFSAEANDYLSAERTRHAGSGGPVLFSVGVSQHGGAFVLFDLEHRQSVYVAHLPSQSPHTGHLDFSMRLIDAVALRSHVLSALKNPITMVHRLFWRTVHSGMAVLPRGTSTSGDAPAPQNSQPMDPAAWEAHLDTLVGPDVYRGSMRLLINGEAFFESLIQDIQDAQVSVDVRLYIFDRDDYALRIADLLKQRSHEIRVRVLVDQFGTLTAGRVPRNAPYYSRADPRVFITEYLRQDSKVKVRAVNNPWFTSDHTKVIIIDGRKAYVGGMNIGREYRYEWHDLMVEVSGTIVGRLNKDFEKRWAHTGLGGDLAFFLASTKPERHAGVADGPDFVNIRPLYTRTGDGQILRAQLAAIRNAKSRIFIQQPYVSDDQIIAELIRARRRGVDVRLILPTRCDFGLMDSVNQIAARALVNNGIRVYAYPGMTHVKAAIYDGWAVVGSANFDKLSLRINQETNLATSDPRFVEQLGRELFDVDFVRSAELTVIEPVGWRAYLAKLVAEQL